MTTYPHMMCFLVQLIFTSYIFHNSNNSTTIYRSRRQWNGEFSLRFNISDMKQHTIFYVDVSLIWFDWKNLCLEGKFTNFHYFFSIFASSSKNSRSNFELFPIDQPTDRLKETTNNKLWEFHRLMSDGDWRLSSIIIYRHTLLIRRTDRKDINSRSKNKEITVFKAKKCSEWNNKSDLDSLYDGV